MIMHFVWEVKQAALGKLKRPGEVEDLKEYLDDPPEGCEKRH